ncbi:ABC transporter ATP-binding protein [Paraliomyxa miuraensis]|uniref:ABC transporter ATP-binding protein n=1 Tax=Paraliomyxa miuraensis TaxID=376150 RepID=UPI002251F65A|nr:sn-glycerol-3-phosphate ABC transporter ATP-binding protein UgpC [Paraliomyxa miuraensis]MCX4246737.1 sn-glycerol-3-phosphate ABC transporter ATP-binding protein UgpC [Paraliomyxa miuraensis]
MVGVSLRGVSKSFGETKVLHEIDAEIPSGAFAVLVGPSGCGKSTLLRLIAGLEEVTTGTIRFGERDVTALPPRDRDIAMVFQSYALYPHMTVRDNLAFGLRLRKEDPATIAARVDEAARMLGLDKLLDRHPRALSGGQRQRVAMGRAIVRRSKLFLFDEPLSNLDPALRNQVRVDIRRLHDQLEATSVYVTHDQVEAMTLADRLFVLEGGLVQQAGAPLEIYQRPSNRFVAGFVGSPAMNFLPAKVGRNDGRATVTVGEGASAAEGAIRLPVPESGGFDGLDDGREVVLGIRPHDVRMRADGDLELAVELVETLGPDAHVHGQLAGQGFIVCLAGSRPVARGERVTLAVTDLHLFDRQSGESLRT